MDIKSIKTDADYRAALKEVESLMMAGPDTQEGEKLDVMVTLIEAYEAIRSVLFPVIVPEPEPVIYNRTTITDAQILALEAEYKVEIEFNPTTKKYDVFKNAEKVNVGDDENPVYKIVGTHAVEFEADLDLELELIPYLKNI